MTKVAILASHNGSGFDALYNAAKDGVLDIEIPIVISNNTNSNALKKAQDRDIQNHVINGKLYDAVDQEIYNRLKELDCEYVFLSGYMKKISPLLTNNFKMVNSHPALLPNYGGAGMYGRFVHEAVIKNNETKSGVTIHEVNENYDEGKIILQSSVEISQDDNVDSLEAKVKAKESQAIVEAFKLLVA